MSIFQDFRSARHLALISTALTSIALSVPAHAQGASTSPDSRDGLAEIVVTAQKREQSLQDVPVAITALTQDTIQANRIVNVTDLSGLAPGMVARQSAGAAGIASFTMRGITSYGSVPGSEKEISIYLDGVYISASRASMFDLPDVARIEVLRGPQGTLFGRNATAGAISVVTRDPKGELAFKQDFTVGNYNQLRSRTSIDLPSWGPLSAYATFVHSERRGDIRNLGAGTVWDRTGPATNVGVQRSPRYLGSHDTNSFFAAVKFDAGGSFRTTYKFDRAVDHFSPDGYAPIAYNPAAASVGGLLATVLATQSSPIVFNPQNKRPDAVNNAFAVEGVQRNTGHSLTSELDLADHLSLKNVAAYREAFVTSGTQLDGLGGLTITPATVALIPSFAALLGQRYLVTTSNAQSFSQQWSDELQLNYDSSFMTLTAGAIYFHSKDRAGGVPGIRNSFAFVAIPTSGRIPLGAEATSYNRATSLAAYAQAELHLTSQLDAIIGGRITRDRKSGTFVTGGTFVPTTPGDFSSGTFTGQTLSSFSYNKTRPNYSIGLNYKPDNGILVYAKYSTAFVSGGSVGGIVFAPETVKSVEGGVKADWFDRRLRTNLTVYHARYDHLQSSQSGANVGRSDLGSVIIDNGGLKVDGVDLEITAEPVTGLTLGASAGFTNARYTNPSPILLAASLGKAVVTSQPKWTSSASLQYEAPAFASGARLVARIDANWRSKMRTDANPDIDILIPAFAPAEFSPSALLVNGRIALKDADVKGVACELALWARNLTNNRAPVFPLGFSSYLRSASYQQARTFGVDLSFQF